MPKHLTSKSFNTESFHVDIMRDTTAPDIIEFTLALNSNGVITTLFMDKDGVEKLIEKLSDLL